MILYVRTRVVIALFFATVLSLSVSAQTPALNTTEWENEALKLRLFYPSDLVKGDATQVMNDGHLTLFGISGASDPKLAEHHGDLEQQPVGANLIGPGHVTRIRLPWIRVVLPGIGVSSSRPYKANISYAQRIG